MMLQSSTDSLIVIHLIHLSTALNSNFPILSCSLMSYCAQLFRDKAYKSHCRHTNSDFLIFTRTHREIPARRNAPTCWPEQAKLRVNRAKYCSGKWSSQAKAADLLAQAQTTGDGKIKQIQNSDFNHLPIMSNRFKFSFLPHSLDTIESQNYGMVWIWKDFKTHLVIFPAMGRYTFQ